ncbi:hypothetical protein [Azospirillum sp. ST 5-10]|uniref:hypothetical protein n=1 Tax=unclassified Azospirillum TaxID=2630922 RepID=UPI003F49E950
MRRRDLTVVLLAVCLLNGLFSPLVVLLWKLAPLWLPDALMGVPGVVFYASSLMLSTLTLLVSGVAAALYERVSGASETTVASLLVWLAAAIVLTLPAASTLMRLA